MHQSFAIFVSVVILCSCSKKLAVGSVSTVAKDQSASSSNAAVESSQVSSPIANPGVTSQNGNALDAETMTDAKSDALKDLTLVELQHFVEAVASAKDLKDLARHQFYFEVTDDHRAKARDYALLQAAIAKKIPEEFDRPVFDIRFIFGDKSKISDSHTAGILGGTGPLSDANITRLVLEKLDPTALVSGTMIHLFSLPPPRTTEDQLLGGVKYGARLATFMRHGYAAYFLASNTAHLNYQALSTLSGSDNIIHLPKIIADRIAMDQALRENKDVILILGTKQAWAGHLYDTIFNSKNMANALVTADEATEIQAWIDKIKQDTFTADQRAQLKAYVAMLGAKYKSKSLLLSCTELPLGLGELMAELKNEGFTVYDTEEMIAEIMSEKISLLK